MAELNSVKEEESRNFELSTITLRQNNVSDADREDYLTGEEDDDLWKNSEGEGGPLFFPLDVADVGEGTGEWDESETESSEESTLSYDEKTAKLERERLIEALRGVNMERIALRRRNQFLHKKLVEHFKRRRMDHVLKDEGKVESETKYLRRLYIYQEYRDSQESQMYALTRDLDQFQVETDDLEDLLNDTLNKFMERLKEVSVGLTRNGRKLNEKMVDRLVRRTINKFNEKGKLRLKYVKLKNLIEEKEKHLKELENIGDGLNLMAYEQLKMDNQNYNDKIEEKEEELVKLRVKSQGNIQNLAQVREKIFAMDGDIEMLEARFNEVEAEFANTRERVGAAKKKRDSLREELARMKVQSGLLSHETLLDDFERNIGEKEKVKEILKEMKGLIKAKTKQHTAQAIKLDQTKKL